MSETIPPKFRDFIADRVGSWPKRGDINYPWPEFGEAAADYMDMLAAKVFGEDLETDR